MQLHIEYSRKTNQIPPTVPDLPPSHQQFSKASSQFINIECYWHK